MLIDHIKTPKELGIAIRRFRKHKKLSQADLAKIAGIRQPTVSDLENGRGTLDSFFKILQALQAQLNLGEGSSEAKNKKIKKLFEMLED